MDNELLRTTKSLTTGENQGMNSIIFYLQEAARHSLLWICGVIGTVGAAAGICIGLIKWMNSTYKRGTQLVDEISKIQNISIQSKETARVVADTKLAVDLIQTNHLAHLEQGITDVARTNTEMVDLLRDVRDGIIKLVDRGRD